MRREICYDEVHDAQRYYRLLMDSMANPGKINSLYEMEVIPPDGLNKASALVAFSLLNSYVSFYHAGRNTSAITHYLILNTSSGPTDPELADFIIINGAHEGSILLDMKRGTLPYPEEGATVIIDVSLIDSQPIDQGLSITLQGPGVKNKIQVFIQGLNEKILEYLSEVNSEFPLGIDVILTDELNHIVCIPRSNNFSWTH